jgi:hypothetical protein
MARRATFFSLSVAVFLVVSVWAQTSLLPVPTTLADFFLPGSQHGQSGQLETPDKCDNCHGGYDSAVEPAFNWRGSMMAQAARDPFFYAAMAVANQDATDSGDLCIRCHSPAGWLEGRSVPTDGSALNLNDRQGVQCDFCHKLVRPSPIGVNPYPSDANYTTTWAQDQNYLASLAVIPLWPGTGTYVADANNAKRGPYVNTAARHQMYYSPFHQDAALCGTCHDVSNPALSRQSDGSYWPNTFGRSADLDNGDFDPARMFPVERTYSEWRRSQFATTGVDLGGRFGGNKRVVSTCQDCHMPDVTGLGANKSGTPVRSDLPRHDFAGGNTFIPLTLAALWPGEVNQQALDGIVLRARNLLQNAASLAVSSPAQGILQVRVTNETGHKLPSGYPEGRRIWINVKGFDTAGTLVLESGRYDPAAATLVPDNALKVYEIKPGLSTTLAAALGLDAGPSFHFVLNNTVFKDNRIPPRGFTNQAFTEIQSPPVGYTYVDGQYWDDTQYLIPSSVTYAEVRLFYQTTSREYVEFLRDENRTNDWGRKLYAAWMAAGQSKPELMALAAWGAPPTDVTPPTAPASLTATVLSRSQINLGWQAATDNVGVAIYHVYRDGVLIASVTASSFADSGLARETRYCYRVTALDLAGNESTASNQACATTPRR